MYNIISERIAKNLRADLYDSLINKDVEFFDSKKTGDLCKKLYIPCQSLIMWIYSEQNRVGYCSDPGRSLHQRLHVSPLLHVHHCCIRVLVHYLMVADTGYDCFYLTSHHLFCVLWENDETGSERNSR